VEKIGYDDGMRKKMPETQYRGSRFCRILGNPTAYQILHHLMRGSASPSELVNEIGLSLQTISDTLRDLRNIDVVRYETVKKNKIYSIKDPTLISIIKDIEKFVRRIRVKKW
jgi:DNA-binding transcriptional ArsR family regulator